MGGVVAHVILVPSQVLLVLTLGLWTLDLGLTISFPCHFHQIYSIQHLFTLPLLS